MNKKLLTVSLAALIGVASMTACVKNDESASVTNLRDAKTMQLKSMAELNTASAQAELIRANAEKAMNEAEAAYKNAMAAVQMANAAERQIAVDKAKATLAADIQAALQKAEADLLIAKNSYNAAWKTYEEFRAENPNPYLAKLMVQYGSYNTAYETAANAWMSEKSQLLALQTGLITAKELQARAIVGFNATIAENEALLAVYNALPVGDKLAAKQALEASKAKITSLKVGQKAVADPVNVAFNAIKGGQIAINGQVAPPVKAGAYYQAAKQASVPAPFVKYDKTIDAGTPVTVSTYVTAGTTPYNGLTPITIGLDANGLPTYTAGAAVTITVSTAVVNELTLAEAVAAATTGAKTAEKAYTDKVAAQKTASGEKTYAELVTALEVAKQAYLDALAAGAADVAAKKTAYDAALLLVTAWDAAVVTEFNANAKAQAEVKALKEWQAVVTSKENVAQYNAQLQAIAEAKMAYDEAIAAFAQINDPITIEQAILANLQAIYDGTVDVPTLIAATQKTLDNAKVSLANATANGTLSQEQAVALQERKIAAAELVLKETQVLIDQVKAKIDAEIKK